MLLPTRGILTQEPVLLTSQICMSGMISVEKQKLQKHGSDSICDQCKSCGHVSSNVLWTETQGILSTSLKGLLQKFALLLLRVSSSKLNNNGAITLLVENSNILNQDGQREKQKIRMTAPIFVSGQAH